MGLGGQAIIPSDEHCWKNSINFTDYRGALGTHHGVICSPHARIEYPVNRYTYVLGVI
jgi:hypothetical protein